MPSLEATLTWATPVRVEVLGAHLEAYIDLLPTINTLKLCHRFGNPSTTFAKLPKELVLEIERLMIVEARAKHLPAWEADFDCYQQLCEPIEHLTEEALEELHQRVVAGEISENGDGEDGDVGARTKQYLADEQHEWIDEHEECVKSWQLRIGEWDNEDAIFIRHAGLISRHFGLEIWISGVHLEGPGESEYWEGIDDYSIETTIAYLTLPNTRRGSREWPARETEVLHGSCVESGHGLPVKMPAPLSASARKRFERMMAVLGLEPYVAPSQTGMALSAEENSEQDEVQDTSAWPQLMFLVNCQTSVDFDP